MVLWKASRKARPRSGPEVPIWGGVGPDYGGNEKAPTGLVGASLMCGLRFVVTQREEASIV